jgi:hypothetical protein
MRRIFRIKRLDGQVGEIRDLMAAWVVTGRDLERVARVETAKRGSQGFGITHNDLPRKNMNSHKQQDGDERKRLHDFLPTLVPASIMRLLVFLFALCPSLFAASQPNFLLVMVDDMGFSDLGCYGSEIETPNMDKLAAGGLRFSQFYNTAKCHSSRVSLLSGRWCRQAGDESLNAR